MCELDGQALVSTISTDINFGKVLEQKHGRTAQLSSHHYNRSWGEQLDLRGTKGQEDEGGS